MIPQFVGTQSAARHGATRGAGPRLSLASGRTVSGRATGLATGLRDVEAVIDRAAAAWPAALSLLRT